MKMGPDGGGRVGRRVRGTRNGLEIKEMLLRNNEGIRRCGFLCGSVVALKKIDFKGYHLSS